MISRYLENSNKNKSEIYEELTADEDTGASHGCLMIIVSETLVQSCIIHYRVSDVESTLGGELAC